MNVQHVYDAETIDVADLLHFQGLLDRRWLL